MHPPVELETIRLSQAYSISMKPTTIEAKEMNVRAFGEESGSGGVDVGGWWF